MRWWHTQVLALAVFANIAEAAITYVSQDGEVQASASYLGSGSQTDTQPVDPAPSGSFSISAAASVGFQPRAYAVGSATLAVEQTAFLLSVSASGSGGGAFPDSGGGSGVATYSVEFLLTSATLAQLTLQNAGGIVRLTGDTGFFYDPSGTQTPATQSYLLPAGNYSLLVSGQGSGGRSFNGQSYSTSATVPNFTIAVVPSPVGAALMLAAGMFSVAKRRR